MTGPSPDALVEDGHGYSLTIDDLAFLQISDAALAAWRARERPLGMTANQFAHFAHTLALALDKDGVAQCDVRLQGSAARVFSGPHKTMPWTREQAIDVFRRNRMRTPQPFEIDDALSAMTQAWPDPGNRPHRRPFDAMYLLGLDRLPSDYDVQISSDEIVARARRRVEDLGIDADELVIHSQHYAFVRKDLVEDTCPALHTWALSLTDVVRRAVTVAVFPDGGPPRSDSPLSAHFRDDDWILHERCETP